MIEIESGFNPGAKGAAGEIGLMQVMPPTEQMLGFRGSDHQLVEPTNTLMRAHRWLLEEGACASMRSCRGRAHQSDL